MNSKQKIENPMPGTNGKINRIVAPAAILLLRDTSLREKLLLSLAVSFDGNGLHASNQELGQLLDVLPSRISDILASLEAKEYIEISNRQSKHRAIHFRAKSKVGKKLLSTIIESNERLLSTLGHSTFEQNRNKRNKVNKRSKRKQFTPPTVAQVKEYAEGRGYPNFNAKKFIDYYSEGDWHDSKGNPVCSWKQKMLSVWLKGKNKPEPKRGDPDWLPSEKELDDIHARC